MPFASSFFARCLADLAVEHLVRLRLARVQERQIIDAECGFDLRDHRIDDYRRVERPEPDALEHRLLVAKLMIGK